MSQSQKLPHVPGDPGARPRLPKRPPARTFSTSMDPDSAPLNRLDPVLTRKGGVFAHKGILLMVLGGLGFLAYVFNIGDLQTTLNGLFDNANESLQSKNGLVVSAIVTVVPYAGALLAIVIVYAILRGLFRSARNVKKEVKLSRRESLTIHDFVRLTAGHGISTKVSREAYRLLLPHYHGEMRARLEDNLERDLHMSLHDAIELYANLLRKSDRVLRSLDDKTAKQPETVLELLRAVNGAPSRTAMPHPSGVRSAARHLSFIRPISKQ